MQFPFQRKTMLIRALFLSLALSTVHAFVAPLSGSHRPSTAMPSTQIDTTLHLELTKPLGLILEQADTCGVFVAQVNEEGSAATHKSDILNMKLLTVGTTDVTSENLETVMELIGATDEPVHLEFQSILPKGTPVSLTLQDDNGQELQQINAKVGDNLRQTLLDNNVEVYVGFKQKGFNCGGAGQCTLCSFDVLDCDKNWLGRSEYEDSKLGAKFPNARLTCLNEIQGPATLRKTKR